MGRGGRSHSRDRRARRSLGRRFLPSWVGCWRSSFMCVCVCALRSLVLVSSGGVDCAVRRRACLDAGGVEGRRACICARALAMLVRGGACCRRSSVVRVAARVIARACACASLASARVFGRRRSYRTERAPPRLLRGGGGLHMHARHCGPLVASRPPGDLKNTTNTHSVSLGHPPVSFELRGPAFHPVVISACGKPIY